MATHDCDNPSCALCRDDIVSGNVWPPLTDLEVELLASLDRIRDWQDNVIDIGRRRVR